MQYDHQGFVQAEDGTRLFYGVRGHGEPAIVFCDGIGCDGFAWTYLIPHLAQRHKIVHWHYRGHGRSGYPVDIERISIADHAADLHRVLKHLGISQAVICGHSMGVQVALEFYRLAPEATLGLVLLCGSYGKITSTFHNSRVMETVLPSVIKWVQSNRGLTRALWGRIPATLAVKIAKLSGEIDRFAVNDTDFMHYMRHIFSMEPELFVSMLQECGDHSAEDVLEKITVPTLVVAAERDTFTPPQLAAFMAEKIPGAKHLVLKGASHAAPVEQPALILEAIDSMLTLHFAGDEPTDEKKAAAQ